MPKSYDIFISYSRHDWRKVQTIKNALEANGISTWLDTSRLSTGQPISHEIERAMNASRYVIVLWSPRSIRSMWVHAESMRAYEKKKLIPVLLESVEVPLPLNIVNTYNLALWSGSPEDKHLSAFVQWLVPSLVVHQKTVSEQIPLSEEQANTYHIIRSPNVQGEFLRSPNHQIVEVPMESGHCYFDYNPDATPLVNIGDQVIIGKVLGVIFALSGFWIDITSNVNGKIHDILVKDCETVDFEQPIFLIDT